MKHFLTPVFLSLALFLGISSASGQVRFGLKAGFNLNRLSLSDDYQSILRLLEVSEDLQTKWLPAYHAGVVIEFGLAGGFGLGTGLEASVKGTRLQYDLRVLNDPYTRTYRIAPMYVRLPLALTYRRNGLYFGVGPYAGYAIAGKERVKTEAADGTASKDSRSLDFGNDLEDDLNPLDYGAGVELGYETGRLRLTASYQHGLANTLPKELVDGATTLDGDWWARTRTIGLSVTWFLQQN